MDNRVSPSTTVSEFEGEGIEAWIPGRFERIVRHYPERLAVKTRERAFSYTELTVPLIASRAPFWAE